MALVRRLSVKRSGEYRAYITTIAHLTGQPAAKHVLLQNLSTTKTSYNPPNPQASQSPSTTPAPNLLIPNPQLYHGTSPSPYPHNPLTENQKPKQPTASPPHHHSPPKPPNPQTPNQANHIYQPDQASTNYKEAFSLFDKRGTGRVALASLGDLLRACGQNPTLAEIGELEKSVGGDCKFSFPFN